MKTRKLILLIAGLFYICGATAQTYYYNTTKTFYENGYTYQCDKPDWGLVTLYNKTNQYTYAHYVYKNGSPITDMKILRGDVNLIADDNWTRQKCRTILNVAFSASEKQRVKGKEFSVVMTIDTSTGNVIEVYFKFFYSNSFGTIPVSTYRKIELELKSNIWFTLTDTGKQLKFLKLGWRHEVE
jgi:hypothetical protein